jgi:tetratricopeptide (TPR) repeat protein
MRGLASPVAEVSLDSRFSTWLLRPYLDLGPLQIGPAHANSIEAGWRAYVDADSPLFFPQRALSPGFRVQLAEQAGERYALNDPRELAENLRTDRWQLLCEELELWPDLSAARKCRLSSLLHSMCLYQPLLKLIPEDEFVASTDPWLAQLAFCRASAKFMDQLSKRISDDGVSTMGVFENIAINDSSPGPVKFNASAMVFVQKAKTHAPLPELIAWSKRFEKALAAVADGDDKFAAQLFKSRFYRGMGFLPQHAGDRSELIHTMDLAECYARDLKPATAAQEILYVENLHAVMESRTKEALWLNDVRLAESRAVEVTKVDPYDSKGWAELGQVRYFQEDWQGAAQAYVVAAMLGPPASSIGRHMAAVCLRELGLDFLAAFLFKETLEVDPFGISPRQEIFDLPNVEVLSALKEWSRSNIRL